MDDLGFVSIPALTQYIKSAQSHAVDIARALAKSKIPEGVLEDNNQRITGQALQQFLSIVIPESGDPLFGLHTSQFVQLGSYSVLGYILMNSKSIRDAMNRVAVYEKLVGDMGVTRTRKHGELTLVQWCCQYQQPLVRRHVIDNVLASWVTYTRWIADQSEQSPVAIWIEHDAPAEQSLRDEYDALFRCPVHFNKTLDGSPISAVVVSDELLDVKIKQADPVLLQTLEQHATALLAQFDQSASFSEQVRRLLRMQLASNSHHSNSPPRKEAVAEALNITARTLQRRLQAEDTSYQHILDDLRRQIAQQQLADTEQSIPDIAQLLGFSEAKSFHRSFKAWTGLTPGEYRRQHQSN